MTAVTEHEVSLVPALDHAPTLVAVDPAVFPVPTGREEEWRFTPLARMAGLHSQPPAGGTWQVRAASTAGAAFEPAAAKSPDRRGFTDRVAAAAWSLAQSVARLDVPAGAILTEPVLLEAVAVEGAAYGQLDITVGQHAQAVVILDHTGEATLAANIDISVADGAQLTFVSLQDWSAGTVHASHHRVTLGRDASIKHIVVTLGGDVVRILPSVDYTGPGGAAEMIGLYFAGPGEHAEHRLFVDHSVAHCRSNVLYKGALNGDGAHTVWVGDVLIRAAAQGTDTYEMNRNLVLSGGGRADSVPNLEIETGQIVGAGHASTTGRFDDEQLFYLMSRGIDADEARQLVLRGFFEDLLATIGVPQIDDRVRSRIEQKLAAG